MLFNLIQSVRNLNYGSLLIESVVLVVGVFLALQAENWNEQRKENIEANQYRTRLLQDFESIRDRTERVIEALDRQIAAVDGLSEVIRHELDTISISKADKFLEELIYIPSPVSTSATYIEMLGGNKIGLLSDSQLIRKLIECNALIEAEQSIFFNRNDIVMWVTPQFLYLTLDAQEIPFDDALQISLEHKLGLQRSLTLNKLSLSSARSDNDKILDCTSELVILLASMGNGSAFGTQGK